MTLETIVQDLKYAIRGLRSRPGFTIAVVATLGLGIGANAAMFGIVDRLLFRAPDLMKDPDTVHRVYLYQTFRGKENASGSYQYARYKDLEKWTTTFARTAGYTRRELAVGVGEAAREMSIGVASASFFGFFDAPPALGRYFTEAEDQPPSGAPVAVLSHAMWQTQYGGARDVLGKTIQIGPVIYTIIGVTPSGFNGLWADRPPAAFIPITSYAAGTGFRARTGNWWTTYSWGWMSMLVQRKPGVSIAAADADLTQAFRKSYEAQRAEQSRTTPPEIARPRATAASILQARGPNASSVAKVATWLGGVSVIVLLIACANVANLLLARALRRRREIALRLALGVSRGRLLSQLLTESLLLAVLGGVAGIVIAHWGGAALRAGLLEQSEAAGGFRDPRTLLFTAAAAVVVGVLTGLAPVFQARRVSLTDDLRAGAREGTYQRSHARTGLLVLQGALSVVLLVGAGLFVRSLRNVQNVDLGYDVEPVMLVNLNMRGVTLDSAENVTLRDRLVETAKAIPGVENASRQTAIPFWSTWSQSLFVEGIDTVSRLGQFNLNAVSPEYFETMGTRILRGRGISAQDVAGAPGAVVVSENMGKVLWPGKDPIGQCIRISADTVPCSYVVGIAENIKEQSLSADSGYYYYLSAMQRGPHQGGLFVRVRRDGEKMKEAVRRRLQQEMPGASYVTITPFTEVIGGQTRSWRLGATMFAAFGALALVLAAIGLYSVIAYNVAQRTHELGVRVALGAQARDLIRLVVTDGLRVALVGIVIGAAVALWAGKWVASLLFSVSPRDPAVFVFVALSLIAVAVVASWIPALRASRVDPNVALRSD
ncbi:MAG TPA: ABC transporter permease [Gemmatimonadaceae bacterium]|nr:ABC transporter permease [Gemmatimonadaceae bacterium]